MGWPAPLRLVLRVLVRYSSTAVFAILMRVARIDHAGIDLAEPQLPARRSPPNWRWRG